ncbi:MAG: LLM class flavin-dependent oxidoreductase [Rhizobiales bacterium]|nr:LLM class flavin-dependent oxidoreductase [Hyphomicrobiales bacterium]
MGRLNTPMFNANRFKVGLFATNCSGGLSLNKAPERWDASWDNNLAAARLAEDAGLEFLLPIARWHGYRGEMDSHGTSLETLTWATGLLAATTNISVFGTVHVPLVNPVFAAKQAVTADHVGHGRFGLNVVSGWNADEFEMFGATLLEHDERYVYTEEWLTIVKRLWGEPAPFDFQGKYFKLKRVYSRPQPFSGERPLLMSAGSSKAGSAFAARHADCLFMVILDLDNLAEHIRTVRAAAVPRSIGVYASGHIVCRATQKEAEDYYDWLVHEMGDWEAVEQMIKVRQNQQSIPPELHRQMKERLISGIGTFPIIGSPDRVAEKLKRMSDSGLDGMAVGLINYVNEIPFIRDELLPRMARLGLRETPRLH